MQQEQGSSGKGLLEEVVSPRKEIWTTFPSLEDINHIGLFPTFWSDFSFHQDDHFFLPPPPLSSSFLQLIQPSLQCPINVSASSTSYDYDQQQSQSQYEYEYEYDDKPTPLLPIQEYDNMSMVEQQQDEDYEKQQIIDQIPTPVFSMGFSGTKKTKSRKVEGQPSKNLMAERRRRKRLNDRLSMLRSIVPKISKMDRTSILGDTIDYMKDLLEKIHNLKEQQDVNHFNLMGSSKHFNISELQGRNPPKFDVERKDSNTQIQICCSTRPGLLLSTVNTFEELGLDIQQCVTSCFNDFSLQASCSEAVEHRTMISSEDMKQILFSNAGYGGKCL